MTDYALTGLVKRRAEATGEIEALHERLKKLLADLESLDATILQFDPSHTVEAIRPPCDATAEGLGEPGRDVADRPVHSASSG
jgi:hypothetical protein